MQAHTQSAGATPAHQRQAEAYTAVTETLGSYTSEWSTTALPGGGHNTTGLPKLYAVERRGDKPPQINVGTRIISQHRRTLLHLTI